MGQLVEGAAHRWGRVIAAGSRALAGNATMYAEGHEAIRERSLIWANWHRANMIALVVVPALFPGRSSAAFIPPGVVGATMHGWLEGLGYVSVPLPRDGRGNAQAAMKRMARWLADGGEAGIAVDGPHGPVGVVRPGALWLARLTGRPIVPIGVAARPAVSVPRWDRHLLPLPGARIAAVFGPPLAIERRAAIDGGAIAELGARLRAATERAAALLDMAPAPSVPVPSLTRRRP